MSELGSLARELGARRALVVTDPGIVAAGHVERALSSLRLENVDQVVFSDVEENPTTRHVDAAVAVARSANVDLLVGLGGGSAMDTAKGVNFLLTNGGAIKDYWGWNKAQRPMLPMIAVPTTAGTGSEAQSYALIADDATHQKMACGDEKAACRLALLDPSITLSQPASVTAACGIDAIAHAIESYVTTKRNPLSTKLAQEAFRLLAGSFSQVLEQPSDRAARGAMLLGAHLAGAAIEQSMLGATHAAANPLSAHYNLPHGVAIALMLPHVIRFNATLCSSWYGELLQCSVPESSSAPLDEVVSSWRRQAKLPATLRSAGVRRDDIARMAREANQQWTARFNPRPVTVDDFDRLYRRAYNDERE